MPIFRRKHLVKRVLAILLIACLITPFAYSGGVAYGQNDDDKDYVVVCVEKRTLGQGYLIEPTRVEVVEGDTAASVTVRLFDQLGIEYTNTGSIEEGTFYLSSIKNADSGILNIPAYITENGGPSNEENDGNDDEYLGEFDYSTMSGWMITVDNEMINVGASAFDVSDGACIRWSFTLWGYGADLGYSTGWGSDAYYEEADKGDLLAAIALAREDSEFKQTNAEVYQKAYDAALNTETTDLQVQSLTYQLTRAYDDFEESKNTPVATSVKELSYSIEDAMNKTSDYILANVANPTCGSIGGEWAILQLARSGKITEEFKSTYLANLKEYVKGKDGVLDSRKYTEYSRVIIALAALGEDPTNFAGYNLLQPLANYDKTIWQGINGAIYALIALDTGNYVIPTVEGDGKQTTRENLIQFILDKEITGGGWALTGTTPDPDITMMTIQGLAKYYNSNETVKAAVERGLTVISAQQRDDGGLASWGSVNSESVAQTICALCALGIDPAKDSRFIKEDGSWLLSSLFSFLIAQDDRISFQHTNQGTNQMATEQAGYALVAYDRFLKNKNGLYDMSDVTKKENEMSSQEAMLVLPKNLDNRKGTQFTVTVRFGSLTEATTMIDGMLSYTSNLDVVNVTTESTMLGGTLNWNADNGALRFVYMDILKGGEITSTQEGAQDFIHIIFSIREPLPQDANLSFSLNSCRQVKDSETIVEYIDSTPVHEITLNQMNVDATVIYQGDDTDWIPANKKAVKVSITGLNESNSGLGFQSTNNAYSQLYRSADYTSYTGVTTYIMLVDAAVTVDELVNPNNYYVFAEETMQTINFADTNKDSVIDAQDALNIVSLWLRKSEASVTSETILTYNVTGDARIDSVDALAVVEYFVKLKPFAVRSK